jgi:hypothetical protein
MAISSRQKSETVRDDKRYLGYKSITSMPPKIRDGLLDEATAWEEWYFQPIW